MSKKNAVVQKESIDNKLNELILAVNEHFQSCDVMKEAEFTEYVNQIKDSDNEPYTKLEGKD